MAESIQVFYTKIGNPVGNITYYHKYLVYTDSSGNQYGARGGPSVNGGLGALTPAQSGSSGSQSSSGSPFGDIETQVRPFDNYFQDYPTHANDDGEMIISGEDLSIEWQKITDAMNDINSEGRQYRPFDQNSNTAVDEALKRSGLPQPGGDGLSGYWSPGSGGFLDFDFDFDFDFPDPLGFFYRDPLLIDLNGDGIALTSAQSSTAYFDYGGDGFREKTGWVNPSDGILVRDLNSNGTIDNLTEMLASDRQDVIKTLQGLDTNADGKISAADSVWSSLRVWRDADGDGVTDAGELLTLSHAGVSEVNLNGTAQNTWDNDNTVASQHTVIVNGVAQIGKAVFFGTDLADAQFQVPEGFVRNTETILLPNLAGGGGVPPLYYSMSTNPALLAEVKALVLSSASMSWSALRVAVENMLYDWAATATSVGPVQFDDDVINPVVINQGHVVLLQQFSGTPFGSRVVSDGVYLRMETVYQEMLDKFTALFAAQSAVSTYMMALVGSIEAQAIDLQQHNWRFLNYLSVAPNGLSVSFDPVLIATKILDGVKSKFGVNQQINNLVFEDASIGNVLKALDVFLDESPIAFAEKCAITASSNTTLTSNDINRIAAIGYLMVGGTIANVVSGTGTLNGTGLLIGNEANDTLNGSASANLIAGGLGADSLSGKGGNDTYIYNNGDGVDTILENGVIEGTADKLTFTGHSFTELKVARSTTNDDLILTFTNNADQVIVKDGAVGLYDKGVEVFTFTGGVTETLAELKALSITQLQTTAADTIKGYANWADTFTGGLGNDTLTGLSGNDTYIYNNGDGVDTILENGVIEGTADKLTFTGHSFAELKVARSTTNDDLFLTFSNNADQVIVKEGAVGLYDKGVEVFTFTGGVTKTLAELKALSITQLQTTAADTIKGYANWADTFTGGLGNDTLTGLSGNDTYIYNNGDGVDTILENGVVEGTADKLTFTGHSFAELKVARSTTNDDLILTFTNNADQVIVKDGAVGLYDKGVEVFTFTGGVTKTLAELKALSITQLQTAAANTIKGYANSADTFTGGLGNDTLTGLSGNDTYIYNNGDGVDTILENGVIEGTADKLTFTGHSFAELKVARSTTNDDLILTFTNNADQVIVKDGAVGLYDKGVEVFTFTGGVTETLAELKALSITQLQTTAADTIKGYANWADTFTGGLGNDTLTGLSGNDTYIYNNGDGVDTILENGVIEGTADKLTFTGHSFAELKVARSTTNDDLILTFTTNTDQVTIKDGAVGLYDKGVEVFTFTGGVTKTLAELKALSITQLQTTAANTIKGYANSADTFTGGLGNDTLTGLSGNDRFVYAAGFGKDIITDFTAGSAVNDVLQLTLGTSFDTYAELMAVAVQIGSNTVINITANDTITLNGVTKTNLVANDFEFI